MLIKVNFTKCFIKIINNKKSSCYNLVRSLIFIGDLHLTTVKQIIQLKPTLSYLDAAETGAKATAAGSDGDTTESEGEEAVPITVRFARQKGQSAYPRKKSYAEMKQCDWSDVYYYGIESEEATEVCEGVLCVRVCYV